MNMHYEISRVVETFFFQVLTDVKTVKEKEAEACAPPTASVVAVSGRRRGKHSAANVCIIVCAVIVLGLGILGGVFLYKHLTHRVGTYTGI